MHARRWSSWTRGSAQLRCPHCVQLLVRLFLHFLKMPPLRTISVVAVAQAIADGECGDHQLVHGILGPGRGARGRWVGSICWLPPLPAKLGADLVCGLTGGGAGVVDCIGACMHTQAGTDLAALALPSTLRHLPPFLSLLLLCRCCTTGQETKTPARVLCEEHKPAVQRCGLMYRSNHTVDWAATLVERKVGNQSLLQEGRCAPSGVEPESEAWCSLPDFLGRPGPAVHQEQNRRQPESSAMRRRVRPEHSTPTCKHPCLDQSLA